MTTVVALGGNALLRRGQPPGIDTQRGNAGIAADAVAAVAAHDWVVVTHGNGPQVGLLAMENETVGPATAYPLDVLDAESEGMIGYLLEQEIGRIRCPDLVATLLTQVVVDGADPAFAHPTKPIGPVFETDEGERLARDRGWALVPDGTGVRRVVASPEPRDIVELNAIRLLLAAGVLVIAAGGGGIPVVQRPTGGYQGVAAVVDKDLTAALLATKVGARTLILLTDVDAVYEGWGTPSATPIARASVAQLRNMGLAAGSMGPKVEAACRFAETGGRSLIGAMPDITELVAGRAGTEVLRSLPALEYRRHGGGVKAR